MTTTKSRRMIARTLAASAMLALMVTIAPTGTATADTGRRHSQDVCRLAPQYLPRTPDAVEGWLRHCPR